MAGESYALREIERRLAVLEGLAGGSVPLHATTHIAAGTDPVTISEAQVTNLVTDLAAKAGTAVFTTSTDGLVPLSGGGTGNYLRADGAWTSPGSTVGVHSLTTAFGTASVHTTFQDEGLTLTVNETAGRRFKWTLVLNPYAPGGTNGVRYKLLRDGAQVRIWDIPIEAISTTTDHSLTLTHTEVIASTHLNSVFKLQCAATTNNTQVNSYGDANNLRQMIIEDI